jgi:methyl-accepting chemotaxis protein
MDIVKKKIMNFKNKILFTSFISVLIIFSLAALGIFNSSSAESNFNYFKSVEIEALNISSEAELLDAELTSLIGSMIHNENTNLIEIYNRKLARLDLIIKSIREKSIEETDKKSFETLDLENQALVQIEDEILSNLDRKEINKARFLFISKDYLHHKKKYSEVLNGFYKNQKLRINNSLQTYSDLSSRLNLLSLIVGLILGFIAIALGYSNYYAFKSPIETLLESAHTVTSGDLRKVLHVLKKDEFGELTKSFNDLIEKLNSIIKVIYIAKSEIKQATIQLISQSKEVLSLSTVQASSTSEISVSLEEISSVSDSFSFSMEETNISIIQINNKISNISDSTSNINEIISVLTRTVSKSKENIQLSSEDLNATLSAMNEIKEITSKITEFTAIISDISDRTNLLSLNASIEAARAGESGRGFAIVAMEITKLAESTLQSVSDVKKTIKSIFHTIDLGSAQVIKISSRVNQMQTHIFEIEKNAESIHFNMKNQIEETNQILKSSDQLKDFSSSLNESMKEQKAGIRTITDSVVHLSNNSSLLNDYSYELNLVADKLNLESTHLEETLNHFKTN